MSLEIKEEIVKGIEGSCPLSDKITLDVLDFVRSLSLNYSPEPGLQLVSALDEVVTKTIAEAARKGCDLSIVVKGIVIGAFRSSRNVRDEAHKTIDHVTDIVLKAAISSKADLEQTLRGLMRGFIVVAKEEHLNVEEAIEETQEDAIIAAGKWGTDVQQKTKMLLEQWSQQRKGEFDEGTYGSNGCG